MKPNLRNLLFPVLLAAAALVLPHRMLSQEGPTDPNEATGGRSGQVAVSGSSLESDRDARALRVLPQAQPRLAPEPPTDFQRLVESTIGHSLGIFGADLFRNGDGSFISSTGLAAPADYVIGPGDEMTIRTWGRVEMNSRVTVNRDGQIYVPQVGSISVAGIRADQLDATIRAAIEQQFKGFNLSVTLGQLRSIQIFVLGRARHPGVFTISSLSTLVNALFASGGPSASGSLRDVQLRREGKTITHFDVYKLLLNGDKTSDVHLLPGDIIYIPLVGPQIALDGAVTSPAIYELSGGSTTLEQALMDAGGLTPIAGKSRVTLDRVEDHVKRTVVNLSLDGRERQTPLQDADIIRVYPIFSRIDNAVTLRGSVATPGRFAWHAGMRVSDLIPTRQGLIPRTYYNDQNVRGIVDVNAPFSRTAVSQNAGESTTLGGATQTNRTTGLTGQTAGDIASAAATTTLIQAVGNGSDEELVSHDSEINWNYAVIERLDPNDLTTRLVPFVLGEAIDHPNSPENKSLEAGDTVVVFARKDINLPSELRAKFARIDGEVLRPGTYRVEDTDTLQDLVRRAGGLGSRSYLYAAQLTRSSVRIAQEAKLQDFIARESRAALSPVHLRSAVAVAANATTDLEIRRAYLSELAKMRATGRVVLQIKPDANTVADVPAFALQDGDRFFVPATPNTVDVLGSVYNQGSLRFIGTQRLRDYLNASGGPTPEADAKRVFIMRADGTLVSKERAHGFNSLHVYPGDSIVVPGKYKLSFTLQDAIALGSATGSLVIGGAIAAAAVR